MKYYKEIQEQIKELNEMENVQVIHSYEPRKKILKINITAMGYETYFGTEVYFGEFTRKHEGIYNTPEQLLTILKKLKVLIEESTREQK